MLFCSLVECVGFESKDKGWGFLASRVYSVGNWPGFGDLRHFIFRWYWCFAGLN